MLNSTFDTTYYPFPFTKADIKNGAMTGSLGITWKPAEELLIYSNLSTGFRAPNIDDVGKVFDSQPGSVIVPNPDLKPEYAYNIDLGITKRFGKTLEIDLSGFYTILNNAMVVRDYTLNGQDSIMYDGEMSNVQAVQNAAKAWVWGFSADVEANLPSGFGLHADLTYQKGEEELDDGSTAPLRHAAPFFGSVHLIYSRIRLKADMYYVFNGEVSYKNLAPSEVEKDYMYALDADGNPYSPSWNTLNFKIMYQLTDHFMVNLGLENITDQRYRPYSSGISAAGRNLIASVKMTF
jgi:hemoglobin/transferrin/lactoferrin receptor protein